MTVDQPTPYSRATQATDRFCSPTCRHASARARSVINARGAMASARSVQVATSQSGSGHRHSRFHHTTTPRRPPAGRSRTRTLRRPLDAALFPHSGQPTILDVVSTSWCSSPSTTAAASKQKPSIPTSAIALSLVSNSTRGLLSSRSLRQPQESEAPRREWWMVSVYGAGRLLVTPPVSSRRAANPWQPLQQGEPMR